MTIGGPVDSVPTRHKSSLLPFAIASGLGLATASAGLAAPALAIGNACTAADSHAVMVAGGVCERSVTASGVTTWKVPAGVTSIDVLTVGGGGGGGGTLNGYSAGGGGGGGQVTYCREAVAGSDSLSVSVGAGGTGGTSNGNATPATAGGNSSVHDSTHSWTAACAAVGGAAGAKGANDQGNLQLSGPSGPGPSGAGGASGSHPGGAATTTTVLGAGGGAGSASNGGAASQTTDGTIIDGTVDVATPGAGGAGKLTINGLFAGSTHFYGGGGGGGGSGSLFNGSGTGYGYQGVGGSGGGGKGAGFATKPLSTYFGSGASCAPAIGTATAGAVNTGGGGGGGTGIGCNSNPYIFNEDAGAGGSGLVLVRWTLAGSTAFTTPQNVSHDVNVFAQAVGGFVPVSAHVVTAPKHGVVTKASAGVLTYSPNADYYGTDVYTVALVNAAGQIQPLTINATITHVLPVTGAAGVLPMGLAGGLLLLIGGLAIAASRRTRA